MVHLHHRARSRRARHLRLHPSPSRHARVVPLHLAHRAARSPPEARPLAVSPSGRPGRAAPPGHAVLGGARGARDRDDSGADASQLPPFGHGDARAERHGHARHARHLRHLHALHVAPRSVRAPGRLGRDDPAGGRGRRRRARVDRRAAEPLPGDPYADAGCVRGARRSREVVGEDRAWRPGASAADRRMGRLAAGRAAAGAPHHAPGRGQVPAQGADALFRALCEPDQPRPVRPGPAHLLARGLRRRTGARWRALLHPGHARRHARHECRCARRRRAAGPGEDHRQREPATVRLRARPFHRWPALLLLRPRRSGVAHDVAGDGPGPSCLHRGRRPLPHGRRGSLRADGRRGRQDGRGAGFERPAGGDVRPRLRAVAAGDEREQLAA